MVCKPYCAILDECTHVYLLLFVNYNKLTNTLVALNLKYVKNVIQLSYSFAKL